MSNHSRTPSEITDIFLEYETSGTDSIKSTGTLAMLQTGWELLTRRRKAVVSIAEPQQRIGPAKRFSRSRVDRVLFEQLGVKNGLASPLGDRDQTVFVNCPTDRSDRESHRIVYVGELTPRSGVLDFLSSAANWADANPAVPVEIVWLGDGDLRGILQAQPLPGNLRQSFHQIPDAAGLAAIFAQCGLMVVPYLTDLPFSWVPEAMAAGLPVLGSTRSSSVRGTVTPDQTGWLFDPAREEQMASALSRALTASANQLNTMRMAARTRVNASFIGPYVNGQENVLTSMPDALADGAAV
jgi:glycosyltransferase involved in cell wall biosynthesis